MDPNETRPGVGDSLTALGCGLSALLVAFAVLAVLIGSC